uniref:DUF647-domain-containing protein n=1 Tax=Syphacia muris TaxID=451379 RepID=A0A0N5AZB6_9BILA
MKDVRGVMFVTNEKVYFAGQRREKQSLGRGIAVINLFDSGLRDCYWEPGLNDFGDGFLTMDFSKVPTDHYIIDDGFQKTDVTVVNKFKLTSSIPLNHSGILYWRFFFCDLFLPKGFPRSVSPDYLEYQVWDTIQAFASSLTSALATEAILRGAGVGNENASVLAAAVAWLLKDGVGMVTKIWFIWFSTSLLDSDCKKWRIAADVLNDIAFFMDLIAPMFPLHFAYIVCLSSVARSIVGVAGCATRTAALVQNVADVAAKDGAQETFVNIFALISSLILLPLISGNNFMSWILYFIFTVIHLYSNYRAVASLKFKTFNPNLLYDSTRNYIKTGKVLSVDEANAQESLLRGPPGRRRYGRSLVEAFKAIELNAKSLVLPDFVLAYQNNLENSKMVTVAVSSTCTTATQLRAAFYGEYVLLTGSFPTESQVDDFFTSSKKMGWDLSYHRLPFDQWTYSAKHE